jgi:hypothetical protein
MRDFFIEYQSVDLTTHSDPVARDPTSYYFIHNPVALVGDGMSTPSRVAMTPFTGLTALRRIEGFLGTLVVMRDECFLWNLFMETPSIFSLI